MRPRRTITKRRASYGPPPVKRTRPAYAARTQHLIYGEMKYFDTERSATALTASTDWTATEFPPNVGTPTTLVVPTVGSAINQRIGRRIKLLKLSVRGIINVPVQTNQTVADAPALVRILLVQDMQTNGAQAQGEDIMAAPTTAVALNTLQSFQSLASLGRFKVWKDIVLKVEDPNMTFDGTNIEQSGLAEYFKLKLKFKKPLEISFNATNGGTIADVVDNSFCVYATVLSAGLAPTISYNCRAYYKE